MNNYTVLQEQNQKKMSLQTQLDCSDSAHDSSSWYRMVIGNSWYHHVNSKEIWKTIQDLINSKHRKDDDPTCVKNVNEHLITEDTQIAESFNDFFTEIGNKLQANIPSTAFDPLHLVNSVDDEMILEPTNLEEVVGIIENLNNVGPGKDKISAKIFKLTYKPILQHILYLFNKCLQLGVFPSVFKTAVIKPIFKGGDIQNMNNYRPISLLPIMSKILERLIHRRLTEYLNLNNIIHPNQFGFKKIKLLICQYLYSKI